MLKPEQVKKLVTNPKIISENTKIMSPETAERNNIDISIQDSEPIVEKENVDIDYKFLDECDNQFKQMEYVQEQNFEGVLSRWENTCSVKIIEDIAENYIQTEMQINDGVLIKMFK